MQVKILLFATLKELAGTNRLVLEFPGESAPLTEVRSLLAERHPAMRRNIEIAIAAINEEYAFGSESVKHNDEVAFFPPVSGGSGNYPTICRLADAPINHDELVQSITLPETGAVVVFSGMVRGETTKDGEILHTQRLEYEAYERMAVSKMQQVADEIREQWSGVQGIALIQRVGVLEVGQNTIVIACSAAHRNAGCFEAAKYGIDRLKEIVPVWKKEVRPNGESWVEGGYVPTPEDRA
jgi:molybdopterin synthase catalytic subunit